MTDFFTKRVAKHILKENTGNKFGVEDPYFDYVSPLDMNGNPTRGKPKKQKKATPPGLTKKEEKVLKKVTRRAYRLDNCINFCGIRIGWSVIAGIIPGLGDIFDSLCALMVYHTCLAADIPTALKTRMLFNIMIDFAVGLVPVLGDVADAFYRANTRNAGLLYSHLKARGAARIAGDEKVAARGNQTQERSRSRGRGVSQVKQAQAQPQPKNEKERTQQQPGGSRTERSLQAPQQSQKRFVTADDIKQPEPAQIQGHSSGSSGGWFSRLLRGGEPAQLQDRDVENLDDVPDQ